LIYLSVDDEDGNDENADEDDETLPDADKNDEGLKILNQNISTPVVHGYEDNQSTSDDNDSTAAAHAAAIGHSPQLIKPTFKGLDHITADSTVIGAKHSIKVPNTTDDVDVLKGDEIDGETKLNFPLQPILQSVHENNAESNVLRGDSKDIEGPPTSDILMRPSPPKSMDTENDDEGADQSIGNGIRKKMAHVPVIKTRKPELNRALNLNERDDDENTALHIAILSRKLDHVKVLLEAGASHRIRCDGSLPIHTAISVGSLHANRQFAYECMVTLHEHGADLTVKDDAVHTPLFLACMFNLPQIVTYILSDDDGLSTLNLRADRAGNRPLHAAAKFDTLDNPSFSKAAASIATGQVQSIPSTSNHRMGDSISIRHSITGLSGKHGPSTASTQGGESVLSSTDALLTQVLLGTNGIEVDSLNVLGQTPLHVACMRRNWPVVRLLIQAGANTKITDRRGHTPGHLCHKRAMPIPNDLYDILGDPPETGIVPPARELIVDPDTSTLLLHHEVCLRHHTCPPILRDSEEPPPENIRRLHVLVNPETGILRSGEFGSLIWNNEARRASIADVLKVSFFLSQLLTKYISTKVVYLY
jgi:ankyrin repeat protein